MDDWSATLTAFAARAIADGIQRFVLPETGVEEMWVSGGGVHNTHLMRLLAAHLPQVRVASLAGLGVDPDAKEALAFAVLANETAAGRCGNLPSVTGARHPVVLGKIALP
jgi:anhydro-N-acetylmuramic acid kinase